MAHTLKQKKRPLSRERAAWYYLVILEWNIVVEVVSRRRCLVAARLVIIIRSTFILKEVELRQNTLPGLAFPTVLAFPFPTTKPALEKVLFALATSVDDPRQVTESDDLQPGCFLSRASLMRRSDRE